MELRRSQYTGPRKQRGELLLATLFALVLMAGAVTLYMRFQADRHVSNVASKEGEALAQFVIGLRGFMASVQADPSLMPASQQAGVNWLKPPSCGGRATNPEAGYVPCHFSGGTFGSLYRTQFQHNPVTNEAEMRTSFIVPMLGTTGTDGSGANGARGRRSNLAAKVVNTALAGQGNPSNGVFFSAFANVPTAANAPKPMSANPGGDAGRVVVLVTNAPSHDMFLRTDGTNKMLANLDMGEMSIANAMDGEFLGSVRVDEQLQVRAGIRVTEGVAEFQDGVVTPDIVIEGIGKLASEGIYDAVILQGGGTVPKPNCDAVGGTPGIYAVLQDTGAPPSGDGDALYQSRVDVTDLGSDWHVEPVLQATNFELLRESNDIILAKSLRSVVPANARVLAMTRCR